MESPSYRQDKKLQKAFATKKDLFLQQNVENRAVNDTASEETKSEAYHHCKSTSEHKLLSNSLSIGIVMHLPSLLLKRTS